MKPITLEDLVRFSFENFIDAPTEENFKELVALLYCGMNELPITEKIAVDVRVQDSYFGAP